MRDYEILLAARARETLLELEWEEREGLMLETSDELKQDLANTGSSTQLRRRLIDSYMIDYRHLSHEECKKRDLHAGTLIVNITPVTRGWPS